MDCRGKDMTADEYIELCEADSLPVRPSIHRLAHGSPIEGIWAADRRSNSDGGSHCGNIILNI